MRHGVLAGLFLVAIGPAAAEPAHRTLTFEDRVRAQEAIERVYYAHQIGAAEPFEKAVPRAVIEKKVRKYLADGTALNSPVTDAMLRRELERMTEGTRMPERLAELEAALGNDPFLIKECLSRPVLVDELSRGSLASPGEQPALPCGFEGTWQGTDAVFAPGARSSHTAVWTGNLMVIWGGYSDGQPHLVGTGGRYDPATDHWTPTSLAGAPSGRVYHTAVWTGNRMIVWGGYSAPDSVAVNTGGVYDPVGDTWSTTSTVGAPAGRTAHTAVWTGNRMVVWGGEINGGGINTGGRYDLATNTWTPTTMTGAPDPRHSHTAVWTGTQMLIFGGSVAAAGFRYDPQADVWTPMSTVNAPETRYYHTAVWTGSRMLVWGGLFSYSRDTGGRYDPASDTWLPMTVTGAPTARSFHSAVWTGNLMIVWGGGQYPNGTPVNTGGRYDPVLDSWGATSTLGAPNPRTNHTAVWTGTRMLVWGGNSSGSPTQADTLETGGAYAFGSSPHIDDDGDGFSVCEGDCNDADPSMYPGAPQLCDGINSDCSDPSWPSVPIDEFDRDHDGFSACQGDCDERDDSIHPGAAEICNWRDDNCDGSIDGPGCDVACDPNAKMGSEVRLTYHLTDDQEGSAFPSAAWDGSHFGVSWHVGYTGSQYFLVLDKFGRVLAGPIFLGSHESNSRRESRVVWNGSEFAVAWLPNWQHLALTRIRPDGSIVATTTAYSQQDPYVASPSMVWTGSEYGVTLRDDFRNGTIFMRLDSAGHQVGSILTLNPPAGSSNDVPTLAWTGTNFAVAWRDHRDGNDEIYFARIDTGGNKIGADVRITNDASASAWPNLAWNGSGFGLAWSDSVSGLRVVRLDATGAVLAPPVTIIAPYNYRSELSWTGTEYRLTRWGRVVRLDAALNPKGPAASTESEATAFTGDVSGLFWPAVVNGRPDIFFTRWGSTCLDGDGDGSTNADDCDAANASVYPGAPEVCDGVENDCRRASWPAVPASEADADLDGYSVCAGDCSDANASIHPGAAEVCDAIDDNCNGLIDEDALGVDTDADSIENACDNCRTVYNADQIDSDGDHIGNSCDNCLFVANAMQVDGDLDGIGSACDNCAFDYNPSQNDFDGDRAGDACDNCVFDSNPSQSDGNHDGEGDLCDLNDGVIYIYSTDRNYREWQQEAGYTTWNSYRGSLAVLRATGQYTQAPGSNPLAARDCGLGDPFVFDLFLPAPGEVTFNLVTGVAGAVESGLGTSSAGAPRANANPCP